MKNQHTSLNWALSILLLLNTISCTPNNGRELSKPNHYIASQIHPTDVWAANTTPYVLPSKTPTAVQPKTSTIVRLQIPTAANLTGHIFIGSSWEGRALVIAPTNLIVDELKIKAECGIMNDGVHAICRRKDGLVSLNLATGEQKQLPIPSTSWKFTPDQEIIYFSKNDNSNIYTMLAYNLKNAMLFRLMEVNMEEWVVLPSLSSQGKYLAGAHDDTGIENDKIFLIDYRNGSFIEVPAAAKATWNLAWSPIGQILAYGLTDIETEIGFCTNYLGIYNAETGESRILTKAPPGICYDDFDAHFSSIWSPDASQVALILQTSLCLIQIETGAEECYKLVGEEEQIGKAAWSPNSRFIAYIVEDEHKKNLGVFSLADKIPFTLLKDIPITPIDIFVWSTH